MDTRDAKLARQLARLILEAGDSALPDVKPALERILAGRTSASARAFLKLFRKELTQQVRARTLVIESAQPLADAESDQLFQRFQEGREARLYLTRKVNADLIGGIKVRLGDDIYDASVATQLEQLSRTL